MKQVHTVLVVDDDSTIRSPMRTLLKRAGVQCEFAADGAEAIEALKRTRYSLILLDLMMPVLDGFAVLEWLQSSRILTPVVVVTAAGARKIQDLRPYRVEAVLTKPFEIHELTDTVAAICEVQDMRNLAESA
ncbi:MAG: response regulator [Thermoanaerobaculia bacterium]